MKKLVVSLGSMLLLAGAGHAQFSDNFNATTTAIGTTTLAGWTVTGGNIDIIGSSPSLLNLYPGNGNFIDLDGTVSPGSTTITSNSFTLLDGVSYTLSFDLGKNGSASESMVVSILNSSFTGATKADGIAYPTFVQQNYSFTQVGTINNAQIRFASTGNDGGGYVIDNVRVALSTAPEPTTVALLGLVGLPFLGMIRRRK